MTEPMNPSRRTIVAGLAACAMPARAVSAPVMAALTAKTSPLAFVVVGDWGRDGASHQQDVADQMGRTASATASRFTVTVGDNFYPAGVQTATDAKWLTSFEHIYGAPALQGPWYGVLGNHDYRGNPEAQIAYAATGSRWRMPARYYTQSSVTPDGQEIDMFMIDTSPMVRRYAAGSEDAVIRDNVRSQDVPAQLRWLDAALAKSTAPWKIVFGHHPVFSGGSAHGSTPELIADVKPLLESHGVQMYVSGHDHDLQHLVVDGVTYVCTGAGSETRPVKPIAGSQFCSDRSGFTAYRLAGDRLTVDFVDYTGAILHTAFVARDRLRQAA